MNDEVKQNHTWKRVCIGDTVECYFDHDRREEYKGIRQFRIIGCTKRFGTGASDLFHALPVDGYPIRIETLDRETFAGSYITKVIHHPKGATLTHAHHPQYHPKYKHVVFKRAGKRNQWCAPFTELLFMALATMNVRMTTVADVEIAHALYMKTKVGMVMDEIHINKDGYESYFLRGYMVVNIKPFTRWVRQNINRMQRPMQECNRLEDEHQRQMEQDYYDDMEREDELRYGRHEHCDTQNCEHDDDDGGIEITDIHLDDDIEDHPLFDRNHMSAGDYDEHMLPKEVEKAMNPDIATDVEEPDDGPKTIGDLIRAQIHRERMSRLQKIQVIGDDAELNEAFRALEDVFNADLNEHDHSNMMRVVGCIETYESVHYPITKTVTQKVWSQLGTRNRIESLKLYVKRNKARLVNDNVVNSKDFERWTPERQANYIQEQLVMSRSMFDAREDDSSDPYRVSPEDEARAQAEEMDRLEEQARK